ncbi:hypothetical protein [Sinorhizobium meliloti]|uniref:hypothetical protein n=1 Tax=Rhizobium meliloti TaxID=382 RepID=UPI001F412E13|nr:hypothetical protein [Sinorhizobium meliloti]
MPQGRSAPQQEVQRRYSHHPQTAVVEDHTITARAGHALERHRLAKAGLVVFELRLRVLALVKAIGQRS